MGNSTISSAGNLEISQLSKCMATMTESMKCLQREVITLKRRSSHNPDDPQRSVKKLRSDKDVSSSEDDQIDRYLAQESTSDGEENVWDEIAGFFIEDTETGESIQEDLASLVNKSLRSKTNGEKMKEIQSKHKHPKNIENLQVAKVDEILWSQLKTETKAFDYAQQKMQSVLCQALVPVIKLMQCAKNDGNKETKCLAGDIFKILVQGVVTSDENRREKIRKNLLPSYKKL